MTKASERSLSELYAADPERADALAWGRRGALRGAALASMGAALGAAIPFAARMPAGLLPAALAQDTPILLMDGKGPLLILGERPLVAETPETLLDEPVTSATNHFIRNNGQLPPVAADPQAWRLVVDGEVNTPLNLSVGEMAQRFEVVTRQLQMECGGNGRSQFTPATRGNQWGNGAISNAEWTGVRLRDVLAAAGAEAFGRLHRAFRRRPASLGRDRSRRDQPRHAHRQGDG